MPLPRSLSSYTHVQPVLDAALKEEKATYTLSSAAAAVRWRQEAYMYRKLLQETGDMRFAGIILRIENNIVIIEKRRADGHLTNEAGLPVLLAKEEVPPDSTEAFALGFAQKLGLDFDE